MAFYCALNLIPPLLVSSMQEQRRAARHVLEDALLQLRLITDNVPALIGRKDRDGRYRFVNPAYVNTFSNDGFATGTDADAFAVKANIAACMIDECAAFPMPMSLPLVRLGRL